MTAPIIITAMLGAADFAWLDGQRRAHFPPERNQLGAHLTLFHHLPPSLSDEIRARLAEEARASAPVAKIAGLIDLGGGVAYRVEAGEWPTVSRVPSCRLSDSGWPTHSTGC